IRKAHLVADRRTKHLCISGTAHCVGHSRLPRLSNRFIALLLCQWTHNRLVKPIDQARAPVGNQENFTGLARLKAHSRSRRYVHAIPDRSLSVEGESGVGFSEMIMAADLDRSVARVRDAERYGGSILVQDNLARCWNNLARYHVSPPLANELLIELGHED